MSVSEEEVRQDSMYQLCSEEANDEEARLRYGSEDDDDLFSMSPLGIVRTILQRDEGPYFRRYSERDQINLARYVWFSLSAAEQTPVRRRSCRRAAHARFWSFPWYLTLPRRLCFVLPPPVYAWRLFAELYMCESQYRGMC